MAAAAVLVGIALPNGSGLAPRAGAAGPSGLSLVGTMTLVDQDGKSFGAETNSESPRLIAADASLKRVILGEQLANRLVLIDPATLRQTSVIDTGFPLAPGYPVAYDEERHQLFMADQPCGGAATCSAHVHLVDVAGAKSGPTASLPAAVAGQDPIMIQFAKIGGRRMVFVTTYASSCCAGVVNGAAPAAAVVALDADLLATDAAHAVLWSYDISDVCHLLQPGLAVQPYMGVTSSGRAVYFVCMGASTLVGSTGSHAAVVVDLAAEPAAPPVGKTAYAFAADLSFSKIAGDPRGDRLVVATSGGANDEIYVFDAAHRSWTGSVPLSGKANLWGATVDPATRRAYVVQQGPSVLVTDASSVPVAQGQEYAIGITPDGAAGPPLFEPQTRRLFISGPRFIAADGTKQQSSLRVYQDNSPPSEVTAAPNPDDGTSDIAEVPGKTPVTYSTAASGYGLRVNLVGGLGATQAGSGVFLTDGALVIAFNQLAGSTRTPSVSPDDRLIVFGNVPASQVTASAATARAVGASYDENTASDVQSVSPDGSPVSPDDARRDQLPETAVSQCSDTDGSPQTDAHEGSSVKCDLGGPRVDTQAVESRGQQPPAGARFGTGSASTTVQRTPRGVVADANADAKDVDLPVPDGGRLHIDEVANVAHTTAHGQTGSGRAQLIPMLRGVTIYGPPSPDASAAQAPVVFHCDVCDPADVARHITARSPSRLAATIPVAEASATPHGAQAEIRKDVFQYWNDFNVNNDSTKELPVLQLTYFNDGTRPSRLVVQLAGVFSESHFTVSPAFDEVGPLTLGDPGLPGGLLGPGGGDGGDGLCPASTICGVAGGGPGPKGTGRGAGRGPQYLAGLNAFFRRGAGQALLLTLVWLLLGTPVYLTVRRRSLISTIQEEAFS